MIVKDENYHPAPFSNGADFKPDDIDVSAVSPLLLSAGIFHFLLTCTDQQQQKTLEQFRISVDGFAQVFEKPNKSPSIERYVLF